MNRRTLGWISLSLIIAAVPIMLSAARLANAQSQLDGAHARLRQTITVAQRIVELRSAQQTVGEQKRPDQDVIARVNAVLAEAGIPSNQFGGLRPESDAALPNANAGGVAYKRQSVRITLNDLSVIQIGAFLSKWTESQPLWIPTRVELTHVRSGNDQTSNLYTLNLLLSAIYVAHEERP